jgi:carboxyvinyl-carboxyphosphonate phosphorylmutase
VAASAMQEANLRPSIHPILASSGCVSPASVYDPLSARAAEQLGFDLMMLAGSVASAVVVGAPDLVVLTLTELAEQCRRITRTSRLPLLVDADHGYGNALSVMRCVEELEAAGVAALTIEDTLLPRPFGATAEQLISLDEATGKLRAALAARREPATAILARTGALRSSGLDDCVRRVRAYSEIGVDGIFLVGVQTREHLEALRAVTPLPLVLGGASPDLMDRRYLADHGVRIVLLGHAPFQAALKAMYDALSAMRQGATASDLRDSTAPQALIDDLTAAPRYEQLTTELLGGGST